MKLKELLEIVFENGPIEHSPFQVTDYTLYGKKHLEGLKDKILECEEFSECTELTILDLPAYELDGKAYVVKTLKLGDGQKFGGKCYLLSLAFTPEMFDPKTLHTPVKDGACITPTIYNPDTFKPLKKIVLEFSPERMQDSALNPEELVRQELHDLLDKVMDSPSDYMVKGERGVILRGVFEEVKLGDEKTTQSLTSINTDEVNHFMVFYLEATEADELGNIEMKMKKKFIPNNLKDKFMSQFEDKVKNLKITGEEIEEFLKENQVQQ